MVLLHFDTENRKAVVQMTYVELMNLASQLVASQTGIASLETGHGAVEIRVVK